MPTFDFPLVFPVIGDAVDLTIITTGIGCLWFDHPGASAVWLLLTTTVLIVSAIDDDILAGIEASQQEAL